MNLVTKSISRAVVVPHEGTWIEIDGRDAYDDYMTVVPHEGTWIEITGTETARLHSHVVPHEGTWIEMFDWKENGVHQPRRSPRGNVD